MPYHVVIVLPDGRTAVADFRDPIAGVMQRIHRRQLAGVPGRSEDYVRVTAWLDTHAEQSERCRAGLAPGKACEHDLVPANRKRTITTSDRAARTGKGAS